MLCTYKLAFFFYCKALHNILGRFLFLPPWFHSLGSIGKTCLAVNLHDLKYPALILLHLHACLQVFFRNYFQPLSWAQMMFQLTVIRLGVHPK